MNPFQHPRVIVGDFSGAQHIFESAIKAVLSFSLLKPILFIHWTAPLEGGISSIEAGALQQLAMAAGARKVYLMTPEAPVASDQDIQNFKARRAA